MFCTSSGRPDTHFWDKLQTIAKRAALGGFDLKKFRATRATDWLRPKHLDGCGYDIQTVRDLLGHDADSESIWSYLRAVKKEIIVAEMNKAQEEELEKKKRIEMSRAVAVNPSTGAVGGVAHGGRQRRFSVSVRDSQRLTPAETRCPQHPEKRRADKLYIDSPCQPL